jgi:UDPglucose 6-dehydrogenase
MRICFLGNTHLTFCMSVAAARRGFVSVRSEEIKDADLVILAEDTPTDKKGNRDLHVIASQVTWANVKMNQANPFLVICSQVDPGVCRRLCGKIYHQPETLRILDATERAYAPECIVVGCADPKADLPDAYQTYLDAFECPIVKTDYETAEFSKIAINMYLASQVDTTNRLAEAAKKCGADWEAIKLAVGYDKRIGTYTTPGRWQDSIHLLRDYVTLKEIEDDAR